MEADFWVLQSERLKNMFLQFSRRHPPRGRRLPPQYPPQSPLQSPPPPPNQSPPQSPPPAPNQSPPKAHDQTPTQTPPQAPAMSPTQHPTPQSLLKLWPLAPLPQGAFLIDLPSENPKPNYFLPPQSPICLFLVLLSVKYPKTFQGWLLNLHLHLLTIPTVMDCLRWPSQHHWVQPALDC